MSKCQTETESPSVQGLMTIPSSSAGLLSPEARGSVEPSQIRTTLCDRVDSDQEQAMCPGFRHLGMG